MFCRNCGTQMKDDAKFCPDCGTETLKSQRTELQQENSHAQPSEAYSAQADNVFYQPSEEKTKKKLSLPGGKKGKLIIAVTAVVVVAALAIGFLLPGLTNLATLLGMSSQMNEVFEAAKKTLFESKSLTIEYVVKYVDEDRYNYETDEYGPYSYERSIICYAEIGDDVDSTAALLEMSSKNSYGDSYKSKAGMLNGKLYEEDYGRYDYTVDDYLDEAEEELEYYYDIDIDLEDTINDILNGKIDEKSVEDIFNTVIRDILEDMMKAEFGEKMELPEYDECMKLLKRFFVKGLSKDAIEFKKNGDKYEYTVDVSEVLDNFADFIEKDKKAASYAEEAADVADGDLDDFCDSLRDAADEAKGLEVEGEVAVDGKGRLTYFSVVEKGSNWERTYEISFSDINKTTVDKDEIKDMA